MTCGTRSNSPAFSRAKSSCPPYAWTTRTTGRGPLVFTLGAGAVITGWDVGVPGMKIGGIRRLVVPPSMAYGSNRYSGIPPSSTLVFEIELLDVQDVPEIQ